MPQMERSYQIYWVASLQTVVIGFMMLLPQFQRSDSDYSKLSVTRQIGWTVWTGNGAVQSLKMSSFQNFGIGLIMCCVMVSILLFSRWNLQFQRRSLCSYLLICTLRIKAYTNRALRAWKSTSHSRLRKAARFYEKFPKWRNRYCNGWVSKHWNVAHKLMDNIRLRSIIWAFDIPQVLSRAEYLEGKRIQKLSLTENAVCRLDPKSCLTFQVLRQFFQLRDPLINLQFFVEIFAVLQESLTHGMLVQVIQFGVYIAPQFILLRSVFDMRNFLPHFVLFCNFGYKIPSLPVLDVLELRVFFALVDLLKLLSDFVHILHGLREPRHSNRSCFSDSDLFMFKLRLSILEVEVVVFLV